MLSKTIRIYSIYLLDYLRNQYIEVDRIQQFIAIKQIIVIIKHSLNLIFHLQSTQQMTTYQSPPLLHQQQRIPGSQTQQKHHIYELQGKTNHLNYSSSPSLKITSGISTIIFTIINFFATLAFRIVRKILYYIEKAIRYIIWINIKGIVSWVNFVYRFFAFFRVAKVIALLQMIAKTYFPEYTSVDFDRIEQNLPRFSLLLSKKNIDLINVDKFEKKVKKPTFFEKYTQKKDKKTDKNLETGNVERQTPTAMVRQQEKGNQQVSPRLFRLSESHEKLKKKESGQGSVGSGIRVQIPRERNVIFPDRDISPERYMKPIPKIGQYAFSDQSQDYQKNGDQIYQKGVLRQVPPYPTEKQSALAKESRHQLEKQLVHLRQKMQELIQDNTNYIKDLQDWLKQKSQTIMMTRTENIELLQEMQELQKQNINKTSKLQHFQEKIREMEVILEKQKSQTSELCQQIVKLNEEIQTKSIEIIVLKDKINRNLRKFQQYEENTQETKPERNSEQGQETNQEETLQDRITLQKLKQQELKTAQLAEQVEKVLKQEMDQLKTQPLGQKVEKMLIHENEIPGTIEDETNLIINDPRQAQAQDEGQKKSSSSESKELRKSSQGRVIRSDGNKTITMRTE